jgi:diguanylate cyclase (GGDEF)-like protein
MREELRVLFVEDDPSDAFLIQHMLRSVYPDPAEIVHVYSEAEALKAASSQRFDVCLLDFSLQDSSGLSTLRHLSHRFPDLPVVVITGHANDATGRATVMAGAQDYLGKEFAGGPMLRRAMDYAIARKRRERGLLTRAYYDDLTGLMRAEPFCRYLETALVRARRTEQGMALYFIDLNGFKEVNDTYGHETGDRLLKNVAKRLKACLRGHDMAARYGGDEFTVLVEDLSSPDDATLTASRILECMKPPAELDPIVLSIRLSIGMVFLPPGEHASAEALINQADQAMYQAKKEDENSCFVYATLPPRAA